MNIPISKLKIIILFFCHNTNDRFLGKVKLMKLFYFIDFLHVKKYGVPITYDTYVNLEHGPIPSVIKNLVDTATNDINDSLLADTIVIETPEGINMSKIVPVRKLTEQDKRVLSQTELNIIQEVCARFGDVNTKTIEDASHSEAPWRETRLLETIPYSLAAMDPDSSFSKEEIEFSLKITQ